MVADIKLIAVAGRHVFTERVDDFYNAAGDLILSARGAGVAEVSDGRIIVMREYFVVTDDGAEPSAVAAARRTLS
ncbi:limonene-1,2-epoxide hydrolase family protein [Rhodococcus sp. NPDC127530]|uniref:limonene-1,2-epoxide hydrolase family protein n=1 Tax=unclassified Rhodococcus (in: high G+C Gram-positive bacteria) TaxID=192944 RepID=UPI003636D637